MIIIHSLLSFFHVFWQLYQVFTCKNFLLFPVMKATHASLPLSILIMSLCIRRSFEEKHHYDLSSKCVRGMKGKMELKTAGRSLLKWHSSKRLQRLLSVAPLSSHSLSNDPSLIFFIVLAIPSAFTSIQSLQDPLFSFTSVSEAF